MATICIYRKLLGKLSAPGLVWGFVNCLSLTGVSAQLLTLTFSAPGIMGPRPTAGNDPNSKEGKRMAERLIFISCGQQTPVEKNLGTTAPSEAWRPDGSSSRSLGTRNLNQLGITWLGRGSRWPPARRCGSTGSRSRRKRAAYPGGSPPDRGSSGCKWRSGPCARKGKCPYPG